MGKHSKRELLQLYLYDELSALDKKRMEETLATSSSYRKELEDLKKLHRTLAHYRAVEATEPILREARNELRAAIRAERTRISWKEKLADLFAAPVFPQYKLALGGLATIAAGFLLGYVVFSTPASNMSSMFRQASFGPAFDQGELQLTNVRFIDQDARTGSVELTCDAVTPIHIKGNVNDERITRVLAKALMSEQNPGVRLKTVSTFSDQTHMQISTHNEVKSSLIAVLKYDDNRGVRKEALKALLKFPVDDEIVEAILYVLKNERNTGMRIAAINFLDFSKLSGQSVNKDLLDMLKEKMQSDDNNYIRIRGNAAFQEVSK
jgi:hypothetical protein